MAQQPEKERRRGKKRERALSLKNRRLSGEERALNIISARLKLARKRHDPPWTMEKLSVALEEQEGLEISLGTIGKIEAGIRGVYDYEVAAFANVLGVSADWLLGRGSDQDEHPEREQLAPR